MRSYLLLVRQGEETVENLMMPWGKEIPVEGFWGDPITEEEIHDFIEDYKYWVRQDVENDCYLAPEEVPEWFRMGTEPTFEEAYNEGGESYNENGWRKDPAGVWRHWIEWQDNPNGIWDMFVVGGGHEGEKFQVGPDTFKDRALKGEIINIRDLDFGELLLNGKWIDSINNVYDYIKDLPDTVELVCICYHF